MINSQNDESQFLSDIIEKLKIALTQTVKRIDNYSKEILEIKRYMYQNSAELDRAEKATNRMAVSEGILYGENAIRERTKLEKLIQSPYFGRIDFFEDKEAVETSYYIGVHAFRDYFTSEPLIYDWRAPISSIFYDFEIGKAHYIAPMGKIDGKLNRKRQYKIREGILEYMLESSLNIGDDILQKELSKSSDDKMKNIVATIQREQNTIIRNEDAKILIIQGAAGSGKTSIALHRVAFLLYHYKDTLKSSNIAIISPNKVFGNYISNVLPELGEENIMEFSFENIVTTILGKKCTWQTFPEQVENLVLNEDLDAIKRIQYKSTNEFVTKLQSYLEMADDKYFSPSKITIGDFYVSRESLLMQYHVYKHIPIKSRLRKIADTLVERYKQKNNKKIDTVLVHQIRGKIEKMFYFNDSLSLYRNFYSYIEQENLIQPIGKNSLEFCDVYPLVYVQMYFENSTQEYKDIKHLLVDEMQDYSPIQYSVLSKLFSCNITILGDSFQSVNPYSSSNTAKIEPYFKDCISTQLNRSYRSTIEITNFTQKILKNENLIPLERHGNKPTITICTNQEEQADIISQMIHDFKSSNYVSLGIICKSQKHAEILYKNINTLSNNISLLSFDSDVFQEGIVITSVHMSKGLEFDQVIIHDCSHTLRETQLERSMLYIACTRAMHQLDLLCLGDLPDYLEDEISL